jgi:hypothetical protein
LVGSGLTAGIIEEHPKLYQVFKDYHDSFSPDAKVRPAPWARIMDLVDKNLIAPQAPVLSLTGLIEYLGSKKP